ncbi:MAG: SurA N-terminal domain-containing protein [Blastocatellia bacterium]|nr:SurA N-terminal domain-containing protein [Blastocatellia bacterium]
MLKFLGKRKRSRKVLLIGFVLLLAVGLIVVFVPTDAGLRGIGGDETVIATVADYDITLKEYRQALSNYGRSIAAGQGSTRVDDPSTINSLYGSQVLQSLIRQKLILYQADQLNFHTTDGEVQQRLKETFNPWPGAERYRLQIQSAGSTPVEFEESIRASIAEEKLRSYVGGTIQVSPQEVEADYRRNNTNYSVRWVEVSPEGLRDKVQIDEAGLLAYYEEKKADFRIEREQRRARYIFVDQNKAADTLQFSEEELKQDFNPERGIRQVRVSQIVLNIPKEPKKADKDADKNAPAAAVTDQAAEKPEDKIKSKADEIVGRARGEGDKQAEDFAALARAYSEDAKSKAGGGDIGWVDKNDKRETDDPLNTVFTMQQGDVSPPILKGDRYYILKVTDRKLPTFEESREQLLKEARARKSYSKAVEIVAEVEQKFKESKNAEAVVAEINDKYGAQVASVKETPFFFEGESLPDLGAAPDFQSKIFALQNISDVADRTNVKDGLAVAQYTEKRDPHDAAFEEVRSKVEERYRTDKAKELAAERARELAVAQTPDALKAAATSMGLKVDERDGVTGNDPMGPLVSEATRTPIYKLNPGEVTREPIKVDNGNSYVVAALVSRKDPDMGEPFESQRKSIEENLASTRRNTLFLNYLTALEKRLRDEGKIEVYQDVINASLGPPAPPSGGGLPSQPFGSPQLPSRTPGRPVSPGSLPGRPVSPGSLPGR